MKNHLLLIALSASTAFPGPEQAPPPATAAADTGVVRLNRFIVENLGLQTSGVELRALERTFPALGQVENAPGTLSAITSRAAGRVTRLIVREGQRVKAGDLLLEIESRVVADPPPRLVFTAPADGLVQGVHVLTGGAVEPDRILLSLATATDVEVVAQVPETRIAQVRPGQTVRVRTLAHPGEIFVGVVKSTAAALDRGKGTLRVFVAVDNREGKLLPGMRAQTTFVTEALEEGVVVPREAVLGEHGDLFVFRQVMTAPFAYERTPVVIGLRDDRFIEIIEGVVPGDRVVTRGGHPLQFAGAGAAKIADDHGHSHGPGGHQH